MQSSRLAKLADRYEVVASLAQAGDASYFAARDTKTGGDVALCVCGRQTAGRLESSIHVSHRHLASITDVVAEVDVAAFPGRIWFPRDAVALIADLVRGSSLIDWLTMQPMEVDRAVAWTIRIAEALRALHHRHLLHGAVSIPAIVAIPRTRAIAPILTRLVVPPLFTSASPERLAGEGPSLADDVWALGTVLRDMLLGWAPKVLAQGPAFSRVAVDLSKLRSEVDPARKRSLQGILERMLAVERRHRVTLVDDIIDLLDKWERRSVVPYPTAPLAAVSSGAVETVQPAPWDPLLAPSPKLIGTVRLYLEADNSKDPVPPHGVLEPVDSPLNDSGPVAGDAQPLLSAQAANQVDSQSGIVRGAPTVQASRSSDVPLSFTHRVRPRYRLALWLGLLTCAGVVVALWSPWDSAIQNEKLPRSEVPVATSAVSTQVQRPPRRHLSPDEARSVCIRSYFPESGLDKHSDFGFLCRSGDFLGIARQLSDRVAPQMEAAAPSAMPSSSDKSQASAASPPSAAAEDRPGMIVTAEPSLRSEQLGWYELVAAAIVRQTCCREASPVHLQQTPGWCPQLQTVVRRIAEESTKTGDISPAIQAFDQAVGCLLAQRQRPPYPYHGPPSDTERQALQQFLKHAAESDALRASGR